MFTPYYSPEIRYQINTMQEHEYLMEVLGMSREQVMGMVDDLETEATLDRRFARSRECVIKSKAAIRRYQMLRKSRQALRPIGAAFDVAWQIMTGMIVGKTWSDMFYPATRHK